MLSVRQGIDEAYECGIGRSHGYFQQFTYEAKATEAAQAAQVAQAASTRSITTTDVPTLEEDIVKKQSEMAVARDASDVDEYERLTEEHAQLSAALARAMRLRQRQ